MKIINHEIKLAIFDLDGTLFESTSLWKDIDKEFFAMHNMEVPEDYAKRISVIGLYDSAVFTKNEYGLKESVEEILDIWNSMAKRKYLYEIEMKPYCKEYLLKLKEKGIKLAVATANNKELYIPCLKRLGIYDLFDFIEDVDNVKKGKEDVAIFNSIANHFDVNPINIAVFEDAPIGLKTAYSNGYITIAVFDETSKNEDDIKKKYSYAYINSFKELL